jgi:hypothetical protein
MANKDLAQSVNSFMLASAPTLTEATPLAYDLMKSLARALIYKVGTTKEHACYVMGKKYSHLYCQAVLDTIISDAIGDEISSKIGAAKKRRQQRLAMVGQPQMLHA